MYFEPWNRWECKSTCAVKLNNKQTESFDYSDYSRTVRQGCVLSPMLFNLFVNELPLSFDQCLADPRTLPNGTKLNSLFYTDDLVILSLSKYHGPQHCLNALQFFCSTWLLEVNLRTTKLLIFQRN